MEYPIGSIGVGGHKAGTYMLRKRVLFSGKRSLPAIEESTVRASAGKDKFKVRAVGVITSNGVVLMIFGGEKPHVGAVALAVPMRSLRRKGKIGVTSSVLTLAGHEDDKVARPAAELAARRLKTTAVAIAGIHVENAASEEIGILLRNSRRAVELLLDKLGKKAV